MLITSRWLRSRSSIYNWWSSSTICTRGNRSMTTNWSRSWISHRTLGTSTRTSWISTGTTRISARTSGLTSLFWSWSWFMFRTTIFRCHWSRMFTWSSWSTIFWTFWIPPWRFRSWISTIVPFPLWGRWSWHGPASAIKIIKLYIKVLLYFIIEQNYWMLIKLDYYKLIISIY